MDDPGWAWPFWKFGLKGDDLFTTLHDRYNTFPSSIQDPEAFHHDVYEIAMDASSTEDFYRRLSDRKQHRLRELNQSLESAAVEIIANPSLIGSAQWQYALQLFRTKSLDSLVRYFASYLPDDHPWHKTGTSRSGSESIDESSVSRSFFDDEKSYGGEKPLLTHEPFSIHTSMQAQLPPSPRSMTMQSNSSAASAVDHVHHDHDYLLHNLTPARTLSFSESDSDRFDLTDSRHLHDDEAAHSDAESPTTSVSDDLEIRSLDGADKDLVLSTVVSETSITFSSSSAIAYSESMESETPTPKPEPATSSGAASFFDAKPSLPRRRHRSCSPSRPHPLSESQTLSLSHTIHKRPQSPRLRRRDASEAAESRRRRSPGDALARIHKPIPDDTARCRPRRRKRVVDC